MAKSEHGTFPLTSQLSRRELKWLIDYDPDTGIFTWRFGRPRCAKGTVCGSVNNYGYRLIRIHGVTHRANRLAVLHMTGEPVPEGMVVDHIDGVRDNDRWSNLRVCTQEQNLLSGFARRYPQNYREKSMRGVTWDKATGKWLAQGWDGKAKKKLHFGRFDCLKDAIKARAAGAEAHGLP